MFVIEIVEKRPLSKTRENHFISSEQDFLVSLSLCHRDGKKPLATIALSRWCTIENLVLTVWLLIWKRQVLE